MRKLLCLGVVVLAGVGGYTLYKKYWSDNAADSGAEDGYWAGLDFGITGWSPQLPIHPKSMTPTMGVYAPVTIRPKNASAIPSRSMDYFNPAQLVPTTGPGNLAPIPGVNTGFVEASPYGMTGGVVAHA